MLPSHSRTHAIRSPVPNLHHIKPEAIIISRSVSPQPTMATRTGSTLYPKITTHVSEIVKTLRELNRDFRNPENEPILDPIPIIGTVKLHGTHADILVYDDGRIIFQSKNVVGIHTAKDNAGFATTMSQRTKAILRLRDLIILRFLELNPDAAVESAHPVLIAGEWIGQSVQKGVAISGLSKRFVIISVNINGQWQQDSDYGGIALPNHDIYNISRAGVFHRTLYPEDPQRTTDELEPLAEKVAAQCPFAATFNLEGEGEGIVWKPLSTPHNGNPALWFKTKGGRFKPTFATAPRQSAENIEQSREAAAAVAQMWTSEQRLEQGIDYLREHGIQRTIKGLNAFLKWVQNDIVVEEKAYVDEYGIDKATLRIEVAKIAKPWYLERLNG
ncbi:hypothetical protein HBI70_108490 [Parastagonospora nodorum]|nr:hypothetical protein HBH52_125410 [Parastagonospora nodorum]KAH3978789.1 hypothetical protein HBH51_062350 [Parastagonospora nodorum]KAH3998982.1 hypothetical protein HBI10_118990 [Parastagonospora nodorum]KAH4025163.1 hypothetical protein HBI13_078200 [Parastagonospora nodorum]KAH4122956.1 hypothetical protein HBH47_081550 [Parastagonospora nodorum]